MVDTMEHSSKTLGSSMEKIAATMESFAKSMSMVASAISKQQCPPPPTPNPMYNPNLQQPPNSVYHSSNVAPNSQYQNMFQSNSSTTSQTTEQPPFSEPYHSYTQL